MEILKRIFRDLKGAPVFVVVLCIILVITTIILSFVFFIGRDAGSRKEKPLTAEERIVNDRREEVEDELGAKRNKYGEVKYDENKLENYAYTTEGAEDITDYAVDQLNALAEEKMQTFDFNTAVDIMLDESKKYNTLNSQKYNQITRPLIDDLVMASAIEDSYLYDEALTKENLALIKDDIVYFYAVMAMDPDYKTKYTIDKNSIAAAISKESANSLKERLIITGPVEEVSTGAIYKKAKDILSYDFTEMKRVPFKWNSNEFYGYFVIAGNKRDFVGYYDKDANNPSGLTTVKNWDALVKEKREMRDPATSNWQEGGPDKSLMPRPDLTEAGDEFGTGEFEEKEIVPKGPQEEAEWPEELN